MSHHYDYKVNKVHYLIIKSKKDIKNNKNLRYGQALMNNLFTIDEELYNQITGTKNDPFYNNKNIYNFIIYVYKSWEEIIKDGE